MNDDGGGASSLARRDFLRLALGVIGGSGLSLISGPEHSRAADWRDLLNDYESGARHNIVFVNGRRALLSAELYPGTYIRDALFWGPLALNDSKLGAECYQWFNDSQLESGQIRSAVALDPSEESLLTPQDDEGTLLFIIATDWLRRSGHGYDTERVIRAWEWIQPHVKAHLYISPQGSFRYWADTIMLNTAESIAYNQGLLCLALRAMRNIGLGGVLESDVSAAQAAYRSFYNGYYMLLGRWSRFATAQDISAIFPEFLSRYLYGEPILTDEIIVRHVKRIVGNTAVWSPDKRLLGIKTISKFNGAFFNPLWFYAPGLNAPGDYQNGGHWPMYNLVALAMVYKITGDAAYLHMIGDLVENELAKDHQSKEVMLLVQGMQGGFDPARVNYTWNALIHPALIWAGIA